MVIYFASFPGRKKYAIEAKLGGLTQEAEKCYTFFFGLPDRFFFMVSSYFNAIFISWGMHKLYTNLLLYLFIVESFYSILDLNIHIQEKIGLMY